MRALLVCAAQVNGSCTLVARLAPNYDLVIAVDGGGDICLEGGVTPDVLVGDLDSARSDTVDTLLARGVPVQRYPAEKDATDLQLAIGEARRQGAGEIVITAATAGRLDHTLGALAAMAAAADLHPQILEPDLSGWLLARGGRRELSVSGVGATVSLLAWGGIALVSATGVRWPLDRAELGPESTLGVSNVVSSADGALFSVHQGMAFVLSPRGDLPPATQTR
jgi:thiamine pyrophosphokinase